VEEKLREKEHLCDLYADGRIILKGFVMKEDGSACTGLFWLTIGTSDRLLCTR
jgi:hypothetical protein